MTLKAGDKVRAHIRFLNGEFDVETTVIFTRKNSVTIELFNKAVTTDISNLTLIEQD